ncbi:VOC family protein [Ornithinimicrobium sp. Arc0846-15]|nr:VOC family protein [Ornithinimicrobium laminariae]
MPKLLGIDHLAITVSDLDASIVFYSQLWDTEPVGWLSGEGLKRRMFQLPSGTMIGLTVHDAGTSGEFNAYSPGMDHLGFGVASLSDLHEWVAHLDSVGIAHSGVIEADYGHALSVKDPDGTALEFFVPGS